jgi:hypothetical protein
MRILAIEKRLIILKARHYVNEMSQNHGERTKPTMVRQSVFG